MKFHVWISRGEMAAAAELEADDKAHARDIGAVMWRVPVARVDARQLETRHTHNWGPRPWVVSRKAVGKSSVWQCVDCSAIKVTIALRDDKGRISLHEQVVEHPGHPEDGEQPALRS